MAAKKGATTKRSKATKRRAAKRSGASGSDGGTCFVIMPFGGWLDDYYESIYRPAIERCGLEPHRADDLYRPSTIVNDIWAYTKKANVLLADLSGKNPNVFYELGLAHALAKPAILIAESMEDIPFDLRALRIIVYDKNAPDWGAILGSKIESSINEVLKSPAEAVLPAFLDLRNASAKPTVTPHAKEIIEIKQELDLLRRELRNRGSHEMDIGPDEALKAIERYVRMGMPEGMIVRRLERMGPPPSWVKEQVRALKNRVAARAQSIDPDPPATA